MTRACEGAGRLPASRKRLDAAGRPAGAALSTLRSVAERIDPTGVVAPAMQALCDLTAGERDVPRLLGFHPLELLRWLLSREQ